VGKAALQGGLCSQQFISLSYPQEMPSAPSLSGKELVADKDDAALETVVVYQSETAKGCGHSFKMIPFMDYLERGHMQTLCPICQGPIEMVCDGMVSTLSSSMSADGGEKSTTATTDNNRCLDSAHDIPLVKFKHRNHIYQLSVMRATTSLHMPQSWFIWIWHAMLHFVGETTTVTAQERIATVLRLNMRSGMRVRRCRLLSSFIQELYLLTR
jgi:hypothetical protein